MSYTPTRIGRASRMAIVASLLVAAMSVSFTGVAHASESIGGCLAEHFEEGGEEILASGDEEAIKEFDKELESCIEAPNPILPELDEIIYGGAAFVILMVAMWKWAVPAMKQGMQARTDRIRADLAAAESARLEADGMKAEYASKLAEARTEAGRIVDDARQTADAMKVELQAKAESDIADLRTRAAGEVEAAKAQAVSDLRGEVASLAVGAAEQVIEKNLDADAQIDLIENYINQVRS